METRMQIWKHRNYLMQFPKALPKYLISVSKVNKAAIQEMHVLLKSWSKGDPVDALELLDARYTDPHIRAYAVKQLEQLTNAEVEDYLLQLVQVLKYETYHDSPLCRFLLKRGL